MCSFLHERLSHICPCESGEDAAESDYKVSIMSYWSGTSKTSYRRKFRTKHDIAVRKIQKTFRVYLFLKKALQLPSVKKLKKQTHAAMLIQKVVRRYLCRLHYCKLIQIEKDLCRKFLSIEHGEGYTVWMYSSHHQNRKRCTIRLDKEGNHLVYASGLFGARSYKLTSLKRVSEGLSKPYPVAALNPNLCLSLMFASRTIDIEAQDIDAFRELYTGFSWCRRRLSNVYLSPTGVPIRATTILNKEVMENRGMQSLEQKIEHMAPSA